MRGYFVLVIGLVSALAQAAPPSHCTSQEKVVFACSAGKKLISVCQTGEGLQYRFGPKGAAEILLPENPAQKALVSQGHIMYSGGGGAYLRFTHGKLSYVVYTGEGRGWKKSGVAVEQDKQLKVNVMCVQPVLSEIGGDMTNAYPEDSGEFEIP